MNWSYPYFLTVSRGGEAELLLSLSVLGREEGGRKTCGLLVDFRQDCNRSFVWGTLGSCEQPQSPAVSIDTVSMGIFWHRDWSKGDSQKWKTRNLTGTNGDKTTCVLISTEKKTHSILMMSKYFRAPFKSNQGCCLECFGTSWWRLLCDQNIFVVPVFPSFLFFFFFHFQPQPPEDPVVVFLESYRIFLSS